MIRIFLSYASEDRARVEELYQNLRAAGFQPWMDTHDLAPGEEWEKGIQRGIQSADCFLACISLRSVLKGDVIARELRSGLERWRKKRGAGFRLIPVRLEEVEIPPSLAHLQWFNLYHSGEWTKLAEYLRKIAPRRRTKWVYAGALVSVAAVIGLIWWQWWYKARWPPGPVRVGVTLWRLREVRDSDPPGSKMLVQTETGAPRDEPRELVPERVGAGQPFAVGDRVRASFEAAQKGFLYVIDREHLSGADAGPPKLIFPTMKIRGGRNEVLPGQLVETPAQDDYPPYWSLQKQSAQYSGELLTVIFAKEPIAELAPGADLRDVDEAWLRARLKEWETPQASNSGSAGALATRAEIEAGRDGSKLLTQGDPLPQTIFSGTRDRSAPLVAILPITVSR